MQFVTRHEFACSPEIFFSEAVYFHPEYHDLLYRELHFRRWDVIERRLEEGRVHETRIKCPDRELPVAVRRALGVEELEYREEASWDPAGLDYTFAVIPNVLPGRIHIAGRYLLTAPAPGRCLREVQMRIEVALVGIGGAVERYLADDLRRSYDQAAEFTDRWIATRVPASATDVADR